KGRTDTKSSYLVGAASALTDTLRVRFGAQFNPESRDRNRITAGFRWVPKRLATISASYRYKRDPVQITDPFVVYGPGYIDNSQEQVSVASQWPLTNKIYAMGRYDYSLQEKRGTQSILGLEYKGDCCWTARVVLQRYAVSTEEVNISVFFLMGFKGLGFTVTGSMDYTCDTVHSDT